MSGGTQPPRDKRRSKHPSSRPARTAEPLAPGLPVRMAAARLLAAVVDAKTPLDGLTESEREDLEAQQVGGVGVGVDDDDPLTQEFRQREAGHKRHRAGEDDGGGFDHGRFGKAHRRGE